MKTSENPAGQRPATDAPLQTMEQLTAARAARWHQNGEALLTAENLRSWLNAAGLVLYKSRAQQLPAPAPSYLEALTGTANPEAEDAVEARRLVARLISEGAAVPLNLLGVTGGAGTDVPDFLASPAVFSYLFTLRGNKAWKQAPLTSGPVKVSPLSLAVYEKLAEKVTLSAYDLATQLGKEVTEAAVLRALTELWSQMRVLPVPQEEGSATLWELSTARFTKQIKAGANAGQPSALSALISLYLSQAIVASEEEIETFLSPLAPRSRLREVIHALLAARQLETLVIAGKTLLHVTGDLPGFAPTPVPAESAEVPTAEPADAEADGSRIRKFTPKPGGKIGTGLRAKPAGGSKFGGRPGSAGARPGRPGGSKPSFGRIEGDRARRPFQARPGASDGTGADRSTPGRFDKPWEERPTRPSPPVTGAGETTEASGAPPAFDPASRPPRKTFSKPGTFGRKREGFNGRPSFDRNEGSRSESRPPRRDFGARPDRPAGSFARPDRPAGGLSRPAGSGSGPRQDRPAAGGFKRPGSFTPRPERGFGGPREDRGPRSEGTGFAPRKPFAPRAGGERPPFAGRGKPTFAGSGRPARPGFAPDRGAGGAGEAPRKTFRKFDAPRSPKPFGAKPHGASRGGASAPGEAYSAERSDRPTRPFSGERPARPYNAERPARPINAERSARPQNPDGPSSAARGEGRPAFAGKKPFSKSAAFAGKGGPFAKFADGKKPFRKPGPGKPGRGKPAGKRPGSGQGGGFAPVKRQRPEEGEPA